MQSSLPNYPDLPCSLQTATPGALPMLPPVVRRRATSTVRPTGLVLHWLHRVQRVQLVRRRDWRAAERSERFELAVEPG